MHEITTWNIVFFIAPLLKICLSASVERIKTLKVVGFKMTVSSRSTHHIKFSKELLSWMRRYWFYVKNDFRNFHQVFTF